MNETQSGRAQQPDQDQRTDLVLAPVNHREQLPGPGLGHFQPQADQPDAIEVGKHRQRRAGQLGAQQAVERHVAQQLGPAGHRGDQQRQLDQFVDLPVQSRQDQFLFAPLSQFLIAGYGWVVALFGMAAAAALTIPLSWPLRHKVEHPPAESGAETGLKAQLRVALRDRSYWCLHAGFFTCGFHIAFLVTHLPGAVDLCGLPASVSAVSLALIGLANIVGSLGAGALGQHYRMKWILAAMYGSRAVLVALYLIAPKTDITFYAFSIGLGLTWLATVPPTAGLVGKLFGLRYLATLFGLTLLSHQIGGFFGAWLGGLAMVNFGNYDWMWYADIVLALLAALANVPIREVSPRRAVAV